MAIFTVHTPAKEPFATEQHVFLRDGFSFPAFIFGPLWLLWNRAYVAAAGWFALLVVTGFGGSKLDMGEEVPGLINFALSLLLGFEGVRLVAWTLERRGFVENGVVSANTAEKAEEAYFQKWNAPPAPPPPPPATGKPA
jgi:hypothetical protein